MPGQNRLFIKVTRETLPKIRDKYPFLYLERGRLEVDESSVKWIDSDNNIVPLPIATINTLLLGPGTSVTHEAIKVTATANCSVAWVGEDSLIFYAAGHTPTADTKNFKRQMMLSCDPVASLAVAKNMFLTRFPGSELDGKSLPQMMGMEGNRVRDLYEQKAQHYSVGWGSRKYMPGKFKLGDITNRVLTASNAALYGIRCSAIHSMGYSPHIGFVHSGSPLPFVYDLADLYKEKFCIDLAFSVTRELAGKYDRHIVADAFKDRVIEGELLKKISLDIPRVLKV